MSSNRSNSEKDGFNQMISDVICTDTFRSLRANVDPSSPFNDVFGILKIDKELVALGPTSCKSDEIMKMLTIALDLSEIDFKHSIETTSFIINLFKDECDIVSRSLNKKIKSPLEDIISQISSELEEGIYSDSLDKCNVLRKDVITGSFDRIRAYCDDEDYVRDYDIDRLAMLGLSHLIQSKITSEKREIKIALFPAFMIFELYLYKTAKLHLSPNYAAEYQKSSDYIHALPDEEFLKIRPDVLISDTDGRTGFILDAKYKKFTRKTCYHDVHQMSAYIKCLKNIPGIVVYPAFLNPDQETRRIYYDPLEKLGFLFIDVMDDDACLFELIDTIGLGKDIDATEREQFRQLKTINDRCRFVLTKHGKPLSGPDLYQKILHYQAIYDCPQSNDEHSFRGTIGKSAKRGVFTKIGNLYYLNEWLDDDSVQR